MLKHIESNARDHVISPAVRHVIPSCCWLTDSVTCRCWHVCVVILIWALRTTRFVVKPEWSQQCIFDYFWLFLGSMKTWEVERHQRGCNPSPTPRQIEHWHFDITCLSRILSRAPTHVLRFLSRLHQCLGRLCVPFRGDMLTHVFHHVLYHVLHHVLHRVFHHVPYHTFNQWPLNVQ